MNPAELKAVVEYMESERGVEREIIVKAIESALQSVIEKTGPEDDSLRLEIDRRTFEIKAYKSLSDGTEIESTPPRLGRIAAQTAKQTIMQKVRMERIRAGLTQYQVSHQVGVSQSAWSHYEQGRRSMSLEALPLLPGVLNCSIADLLPASIVTAVDQRRSKDMRLEEIIVGWPDLSDQAKRHLLETFRIVSDVERANAQRVRALKS